MATAYLKRLSVALCFFLLVPYAYAEKRAGDEKYVPQEFQEGKDVVWVPTDYKLAEKMLNIANVTARDYVIDLGSGDGRIVIAAAKRGASALGIEYNPDLVGLSIRNAIREGVADKAKFVQGDIFESDFSNATVITMFLLPELNLKLRPIILDMKPGIRVVSNSFNMGDWLPDKRVAITAAEGCKEFFCEAFFWIVPAKIEGVWRLAKSDLIFKQTYQNLTGQMKTDLNTAAIEDGRLRGPEISFKCNNALYTGVVEGSTMNGTFKKDGGRERRWHAKRIGDLPKDHPSK